MISSSMQKQPTVWSAVAATVFPAGLAAVMAATPRPLTVWLMRH